MCSSNNGHRSALHCHYGCVFKYDFDIKYEMNRVEFTKITSSDVLLSSKAKTNCEKFNFPDVSLLSPPHT